MKNLVSFKKCILAWLVFAPLMQEAWATDARSDVDRRIKQLNTEIDTLEDEVMELSNGRSSIFEDVLAILKSITKGNFKALKQKIQSCIDKLSSSTVFSNKMSSKRKILDDKYEELYSLINAKYEKRDSPMEAQELTREIIALKQKIADTRAEMNAINSKIVDAQSSILACLVSMIATVIAGALFPPMLAAVIVEILWLCSELGNLLKLSMRFEALDKRLSQEREVLMALEK